jgi:hypothetical protein
VFLVVTEPGNYLRYASFGNLLKASLEGLPPGIVFSIGFRVDNSLYYKPAVGGNPSYSKWFMYPGGFTNPAALLLLGNGSSIATPAAALTDFVIGFDPDAPGAWDRDGDGWPDFDDINPDDPNVGGFPQ